MNARVCCAVLLLASAGCVQVSFDHHSTDDPCPQDRLGALQPGHDSLGDCLSKLGAPRGVFEYRVEPDGTSGMALLWVWPDQAGFGLDVSAPSEAMAASFELDLANVDQPGCMLWFTKDLVLEQWHSGGVGQLLHQRARPSFPE